MHLMKSLCCAAAITLLAVSGAHADEWNKKTYLTFSGPVQIPGATLPAGTYLFQLADPDNARHVVMVASKDGSHVYGMFITIPNDRLDTPDENVVMFGEAPAGAPQAVQAWWYPGERIGEEFVYPKNQATAIAKANHKEVLATDSDVNANGSENDRMASLRGSKVGRVDENGTMKDSANAENHDNTSTAPQTAAAVTADRTQAAGNMTHNTPTNPSASAKPGVNDGYQAKSNTAQSTTAAATTTAPANTVDGRNATTTSGARAKTNTTTARSNTARSHTANNTVGTSGQANTNTADNNANASSGRRTRRSLPRTASSLELVELLSALSLGVGFSIRRLRVSEAR